MRARHDITITRPDSGGGTLSPDGDLTKTGTPVFAGRVVIVRAIRGVGATSSDTDTVGERSRTTTKYLIDRVPIDADVAEKDLVTVDDSPDSRFVGIHMRVVDMIGAGRVRQLVCEVT